MALEKFNELYLGKAIHCKTEELANEFLKLADSVGYRWWSGNKLTKFSNWDRYQSNTCYSIYADRHVLYDNIDYEDLPIVEFKGKKKMSKELEALRKVLYYDTWDCYNDKPKEMRKDEEEAYNYILSVLTPPTAEEVVKELSEQLKSTIVLRKNKHGITFNYAGTGKTIVSLNYNLLNIKVQLPTHLIAMIGRFYEGELPSCH